MELVDQRSDAGWLQSNYAASERRVCGLMGMAVSSYRYESKCTDEPLRTRLVELAREKPRYGSPRLHVLLQREGWEVNHKRVERVYREAGLVLRRKKRKHCVRVGRPLVERTAADQEWALDFVHDAVECGRTIRVLSVVDAYTRECLALEVDTSFASRRVTRVLEGIIAEQGIIAERGLPQTIRCDNGPELTSRHFLAWAIERKIELAHIQPGKPMQNGRLESFNGKLREECLNISWFQNLFHARACARPQSSPAHRTGSETNSGTSSTTLAVVDALYFQDGTWGSDLARTSSGLGGTMQPDWIAIGTVSNVVQIASITYGTYSNPAGTITLASPMTWTKGAQTRSQTAP